MRIFGERITIKPQGFDTDVELGIYRVPQGFTACDFKTGKSFQVVGKTKQDAINAASAQLETLTPTGLTTFLSNVEVLNTGVESAYRA